MTPLIPFLSEPPLPSSTPRLSNSERFLDFLEEHAAKVAIKKNGWGEDVVISIEDIKSHSGEKKCYSVEYSESGNNYRFEILSDRHVKLEISYYENTIEIISPKIQKRIYLSHLNSARFLPEFLGPPRGRN